MNIRITKVKSSGTFEGELDGEILAEVLQRLNLPLDYGYVIKVEGDYYVEWDHEIAMPVIETLYAVNPTDDKLFTDLSELVDIDTVNEQLDKFADDCYGDWCEDKAGMDCDRAYDDYVDRMMDEAND